jgi:archaellum component FlaF (FlaF/FlaG flagellin family)
MRGKNKQSASKKNYKNTPSNLTNTNLSTANKTISSSICHAKINPTNHIQTQINSTKIPPVQNAPTSSNS